MTETRMKLRSSVSVEDRDAEKERVLKEKQEFMNRPFIKYDGLIKYITTFIDTAIVCDELLKAANNSTNEFVIGFDMEWPFSFQTGPGKTSVIQISPNLDICYILQVGTLKNLPKGLNELLIHPKTRITGVNIKNDVRKLARDFGVNGDKIIENCIDSGTLANSIFSFRRRWSMEKLVDYLLKMRIDKNKEVRMSKWNCVPLSKQQLTYAAIDAYASLLLYQKLMLLQATNSQVQDS